MNCSLSVPSKTFLAGEYLALTGEGSLVVATAPRFYLEIESSAAEDLNYKIKQNYSEHPPTPFHTDSPAGFVVRQNQETFKKSTMKFLDPHKMGGWGRSTAEFILAYAAVHPDVQFDSEKIFSLHGEYQKIVQKSESASKWPASGADLVGQICGGITYFSKNKKHIETFKAWPFSNLNLWLVSTGVKLATHEHLRDLKHIETTNLSKSLDQIVKAFETKNADHLLAGINSYYVDLKKQNFVSELTLRFVEIVRAIDLHRIAAKGCGALGADVIALVFDKDAGLETKIEALIKEFKMSLVATQKNIEQEGYKTHVSC